MLSDGEMEVSDLLIMLEPQFAALPVPRLIVITACNSARVGAEIHNKYHVPVVVMQTEIGDRAAIDFSETFYRAYRTTSKAGDAVAAGHAMLQRKHPTYADAVTLINGDDMTRQEADYCMELVEGRLEEMDKKIDRIEEVVNEIKSHQSKTLLILLGLLLLAQLVTPFLNGIFVH